MLFLLHLRSVAGGGHQLPWSAEDCLIKMGFETAADAARRTLLSRVLDHHSG